VKKIVHEREEIVDEPLMKEEIHVERVMINRYVEAPVPVRQEDGVTIVPVMEEVLVVEKKLLLKEELRITKRTKTVREPQRVIVKIEEVLVENCKTKDGAD
jgi:stress response protein YsnF